MGGFTFLEGRWTCADVVNGQVHVPFHRDCLRNWVQINPRCPYDQTPINPNSPFVERTEVIWGKAKRCLVNVACSASLSGVVLGTAALGCAATGIQGEQAQYLSLVSTTLPAHMFYLGGMAAELSIHRTRTAVGRFAEMFTAMSAIEYNANIPEELRVWNASKMVGSATICIGMAAHKIFTKLGISEKDRVHNIPIGIYVGAATASMISGDLATTLAIVPIVSGIFTGMSTVLQETRRA